MEVIWHIGRIGPDLLFFPVTTASIAVNRKSLPRLSTAISRFRAVITDRTEANAGSALEVPVQLATDALLLPLGGAVAVIFDSSSHGGTSHLLGRKDAPCGYKAGAEHLV